MSGKIYTEIQFTVLKVIEALTDDEEGGFRTGRVCVDQIFTLK